MPTIPPGYGQVLIPFKHSSLARAAAITFGVDMNGQGGSAGLATKIQGDFLTEFQAVLDTNVTVGPTKLFVGQDFGESLVYVATATADGTSAQESFPPNVNLLVTKTTNRGGRRGRGRFYIPWTLSEAAVNEVGIVSAATLANQQTRLNDFLEALDTDIGAQLATPMVLLHSPGQTAEGLPNPVVSLVGQAVIGSQRRRLGR